MKPSEILRDLGACSPAIFWTQQKEDLGFTWEDCWTRCPKWDWKLWLLIRLSGRPDSPERKKILFTCINILSADTSYKGTDLVPLDRVYSTGRAYACGEASLQYWGDSMGYLFGYVEIHALWRLATDISPLRAAKTVTNDLGPKNIDLVGRFYPNAPKLEEVKP